VDRERIMRGEWVLVAAFLLAPGIAQGQEATAPPEPAAPTAREPEVEARPAPTRRARAFWSVEGGYAYQNLYGVPMSGVDLAGAVSGNVGTLAIGALLEGIPGSTENGLKTLTLSGGPLVQGIFDRVRLGGGLRVGLFDVSRATAAASLLSLSAGVHARASLDVVSFDKDNETALFLVVKGSIDSVDGALYGATAGLGLRL
jgi:hypothetical protein